MSKRYKIYETIKYAVCKGFLKQPFNVKEVNSKCNGIISKCSSF